MKDEHSIVEKIIAGKAKLEEFDLNSDFTDEELRVLLDESIIQPCDLAGWRASDMIISGTMSYEEYPFEDFSHYEQIRQLEHENVSLEEFKAKVGLGRLKPDDWLYLLQIRQELDSDAPWEKIRAKASVSRWLDFLTDRPECAGKADWARLLNADSRTWVEALIKCPQLATLYPLEDLDEADEIQHLLLHRPEFAEKITWNQDNPPVKLFISNPHPEPMTLFRENPWFFPAEISPAIRPVIQKELFHNPTDAEYVANCVGHQHETFAGIFGAKTAETVMRNFRESVNKTGLELAIRLEKCK